jgi:hypothetical protein
MKWKEPFTEEKRPRLPPGMLVNTLRKQRNEALDLLERWRWSFGEIGPGAELVQNDTDEMLDKMRAEPAKIERLQTDTEVYAMNDMRDTINKLVDKVNSL